jgi:hypothetical protein
MMDGYTTKVIFVTRSSGMTVSALIVPGGVLMITECDVESGNGIALSVSTTFVPMTDDTREQYLDAIAREQDTLS